MITKINRQDCLALYPKFPRRDYDEEADEYLFYYPDIISQYVLTLKARTFSGLATQLGLQLAELIQSLGIDSLVFLGDVGVSWRYQENSFKPVNGALKYLADNNVGKRFNGALIVHVSELPQFIKHFAWLVRCNASLPYFHFTDRRQNIMAHLCQYGNLHIDSVTTAADKLLDESIRKTDFECIKEEECNNRFGKTSAIHGRQIVL